MQAFYASHPDLEWPTEEIVAEGDKVAIHLSARGTHECEFWGVPPSGKEVVQGRISISRFEGGRIFEE
ncbi:MAG: ester cyclase [Anaerolineae bacterium]